jgi:hypothetical protein
VSKIVLGHNVEKNIMNWQLGTKCQILPNSTNSWFSYINVRIGKGTLGYTFLKHNFILLSFMFNNNKKNFFNFFQNASVGQVNISEVR